MESCSQKLIRVDQQNDQAGCTKCVERMHRPLRKRRADKERRHDDGSHNRRRASGQQHVEAQHQHRNEGARPLRCLPRETESQQHRTQKAVKHHPDEKHVQARDGEQMHQSRSSKVLAILRCETGSIAEQQGLQDHAAAIRPDMLPDDVTDQRAGIIDSAVKPRTSRIYDCSRAFVGVEDAGDSLAPEKRAVIEVCRIAFPRQCGHSCRQSDALASLEFGIMAGQINLQAPACLNAIIRIPDTFKGNDETRAGFAMLHRGCDPPIHDHILIGESRYEVDH